MQFVVKRDTLLKSLNFVQGVVEKKNTLPILSNVLLLLKDKKLSIVATDLDIIFYDEISDVKILKEGSITTSAAILYDILRKISSNSELNFDLKSENKLSLKSENADFNLLCLPFLSGKNPSKTNFSFGKPELTSAGTNAVAPGKQSTSISFLTYSLTNKNPGSEIAGVPASEISANFSPDFILSIYFANTKCSLCI